MNDIQSLSHSKWRCKYPIVFAPKYRIQEMIREDIPPQSEYIIIYTSYKEKESLNIE